MVSKYKVDCEKKQLSQVYTWSTLPAPETCSVSMWPFLLIQLTSETHSCHLVMDIWKYIIEINLYIIIHPDALECGKREESRMSRLNCNRGGWWCKSFFLFFVFLDSSYSPNEFYY